MRRGLFQGVCCLVVLAGCKNPLDAKIAVLNEDPIFPRTVVELDGSGSSNAKEDGAPLAFTWRVSVAPPDSVAAIANDRLSLIGFVPDVYGEYELGLVVSTDTDVSEEAFAGFTVDSCGNEAPTVDGVAADPASPITGDVVQLSAAVSDPDVDGCGADATLGWAWSLASRPVGSSAALIEPGSTTPSFLADVPGTYAIELILTDADGHASATAETTVDVSACGDATPAVVLASLAPAAPDIGDLVQIGLRASDADIDTCGIAQTLAVSSEIVEAPFGSGAQLWPSDGIAVSFVPDVAGSYTIRTTVRDSTGRMATVDNAVNVAACGGHVPTIDSVAQNPATATTGSWVELDVIASDADITDCGLNQTLSITSAIVSAPAGASASLEPAAGSTPAFVPDRPGTYTVRTWVTDDTARMSWVDTDVVVDVCGSQDPVAMLALLGPFAAGPATDLVPTDVVSVDEDVWLDGAASFDPDFTDCGLDQDLTYTWAFKALPAGSFAEINDSYIVNPSFRPDVSGTYTVELTVSDGTRESSATFTIVAVPVDINDLLTGYSIELVDQGGPFDQPEGIAVDTASGNIYVVQNGASTITVTDTTGSTSTAYAAGYLSGIHDVVWYGASSYLFVTSTGYDDIIRITSSGTQTRWSSSGVLDNPHGITLYTTSSGSTYLYVADSGNDRVRWYNPASSATVSSSGSDDFGGNLDNPWGVMANNASGTNQYFTTNSGSDELWRSTGSGQTEITSILDEAHDIVMSPSGKLVVADSQSGNVYLFDNCTSGTCSATVLVEGTWEPWGLAWESSSSLLITDRSGDALYRITGSF